MGPAAGTHDPCRSALAVHTWGTFLCMQSPVFFKAHVLRGIPVTHYRAFL